MISQRWDDAASVERGSSSAGAIATTTRRKQAEEFPSPLRVGLADARQLLAAQQIQNTAGADGTLHRHQSRGSREDRADADSLTAPRLHA